MNVSVVWDIVARTKIEGHESVARVTLLSYAHARGVISHRTGAFIV